MGSWLFIAGALTLLVLGFVIVLNTMKRPFESDMVLVAGIAIGGTGFGMLKVLASSQG